MSEQQQPSPYSNKNYFNKDTEDAILEFQKEQDIPSQKRIFVDKIRPSFEKLVENIINVYNFHSIGNTEVLHYDCISMLFESLYKFDGTKGHKAFSYFNVVAKNWFIQKYKIHKKRSSTDIQFDKSVLSYLEKKTEKVTVDHPEEDIVKREFLELLKKDIETWDTKFTKPQEKLVLEAIDMLINNPELPTIYNKKGVYLFLREITDLNTKQIVTNLSKFRKRYALFKKRYESGQI